MGLKRKQQTWPPCTGGDSPDGCEATAPLRTSLGAQIPEEGQTAGPAASRDRQSRAPELAFCADLREGIASFFFFIINKPLSRQ